ncbi:MAG: ABC transporter ATP-binding protein [Thermoplasmata archaeon]|nr:ABC transporter ATP-binding protein [Thermoplasmata archaeon]
MRAPSASGRAVAGLEGVTVRFGSRTVLHEVDLSVGAGEFVALAGPNGSGKTTLLRVLLGFIRPSAGRATLFGTPVDELPITERARRVAWVPQEEANRDNPTVREYVGYGRYPYRGRFQAESAVDRERVEESLSDLGLGDRGDDGVQTLSGGERQRAVLGRALAQDTPLILLDEPTSHLDIGHQLDILERVRTLSRRRGTTVIAALHDLNLAARFADRVVILSRGRKYDDGDPARVLSEGLLARVWGVTADLRRDPRTGVPYLLPHQRVVEGPAILAGPGFGPVHVVGGGGAGAPVLRALSDDGYRVTTGALHLLDTDAETAEVLGIPMVVEVPFAPLGAEVRSAHRRLLEQARVIVVAPFAVGPSNIANLDDLEPFVPQTPTYLLAPTPIDQRDFAGGAGARAWEALRSAGAREVDGLPALQAELRSLEARWRSAVPAAAPALPS